MARRIAEHTVGIQDNGEDPNRRNAISTNVRE